MANFSEGQLNKFKHLMRVAARFLFAGDLLERAQEADKNPEADDTDALLGRKKQRRTKVCIYFMCSKRTHGMITSLFVLCLHLNDPGGIHLGQHESWDDHHCIASGWWPTVIF